MNTVVLTALGLYLLAIFFITLWSNRKAKESNHNFFSAERNAPWWVVAIGMIGDSISGVTFVSVPGMVRQSNMSYLQLCIGFFFGYIIVAQILLPLYYRLNLISIYGYLKLRFGSISYKTGASFFIISKMFGASIKLYLITLILQTLVFEALGIPYWVTVFGLVTLIWLYTSHGGMGTILWTDMLQTASLILALCLIIYEVTVELNLNLSELVDFIRHDPYHSIVVWDDWLSPHHLIKQLLGGAFIVIVMTGLDQNMMQKNLTCRSLPEAKKNMLSYGFSFIPLNYLFLILGSLLLSFAISRGITLPDKGDELLPYLVQNHLGLVASVSFFIGIIASSFSNADSALTSLTTSICVDLLGEASEDTKAMQTRKIIHAIVCFVFALLIVLISKVSQGSILNTIYTAVSYTYGPLLGLYAFGMMFRYRVRERFVPFICLIAPVLCHLISISLKGVGYTMGYELLLINGLITMLGLWMVRLNKPCTV